MFTDLKTAARPALMLTLLFAALLGLAYPLLLTGVGQLVFPRQANGSLARDGMGRIVGSTLIGQAFVGPAYFNGRPSAAGKGYDALASAGSNLGPASLALTERIRAAIVTNRIANRSSPGSPVPADLVTTSASGLDPDLSPEAALYQVARVAAARRVTPARLRDLIAAQTVAPALGFVGERHVNVLALNRALDRIAPRS